MASEGGESFLTFVGGLAANFRLGQASSTAACDG
jgi:hypothetical protein